MADITITIPDAQAADVLDAFATRYDYTRLKQTGETKSQFAKRMIAAHVHDIYIWYMAKQASDTAANAAAQVVVT